MIFHIVSMSSLSNVPYIRFSLRKNRFLKFAASLKSAEVATTLGPSSVSLRD